MRNTVDKRSVCRGSAGGRKEGYQETRTSCTSYPSVPQRREDWWEFPYSYSYSYSYSYFLHYSYPSVPQRTEEEGVGVLLISTFTFPSSTLSLSVTEWYYDMYLYVIFVFMWCVCCICGLDGHMHAYLYRAKLTEHVLCNMHVSGSGNMHVWEQGGELPRSWVEFNWKTTGPQVHPKWSPSGPHVVPKWSTSELSVSYLISSKRCFSKLWVFPALYLTVPACTWVNPVVPACACLKFSTTEPGSS